MNELPNVLCGFIMVLLSGVGLMVFDNLVLTMIGLGLLTLAFFAAHTMASRIVAIHGSAGKVLLPPCIDCFIIRGPGYWQLFRVTASRNQLGDLHSVVNDPDSHRFSVIPF